MNFIIDCIGMAIFAVCLYLALTYAPQIEAVLREFVL
jgi:hypothetical protein